MSPQLVIVAEKGLSGGHREISKWLVALNGCELSVTRVLAQEALTCSETVNSANNSQWP